MKVLLVDDDPDAIFLTSYVLENLGGFEVTTSEGGNGVVDLARRELPDVILMDFLMPKPDGGELAERLRCDPQTALIPLIFLTAKEGRDHRARLLGFGACGVIVKPFDPETLCLEVRQLLATSDK